MSKKIAKFEMGPARSSGAAASTSAPHRNLVIDIGTRVWFCNLSDDEQADYGKLNGKPCIVRDFKGRLDRGQVYVEPDYDSCSAVALYAPNGDRFPVPWRMLIFSEQVSFDAPRSRFS